MNPSQSRGWQSLKNPVPFHKSPARYRTSIIRREDWPTTAPCASSVRQLHIIESGHHRLRLKLDVRMHGLCDLVAGFDEGGGDMGGGGSKEGLAVGMNFFM